MAALLRPSQLARFWEMHPKTIYQWIREGRLVAVRTPGAQYRLRASDVRDFCEREQMAVPPFAQAQARRVHLVGAASAAVRAIKRALVGIDVALDAFASPLEGLFATVRAPPALLAVDGSTRGVDLVEAIRALRRATSTERVPIVAFDVASATRGDALLRAGATRVLLRKRRTATKESNKTEPTLFSSVMDLLA